MIVVTVTGLAVPYLVKIAIDSGIQKGDLRVLDLVIVAFLAVNLLNLGASYVQTYLVSWVGERVILDLRRSVFAHIQKLSLDFFSRQRTGWIVSRMTNDIDALDQLVTDGVTSLVTNGLTIMGAAVLLFVLDWRLALATLAIMPLAAGRHADVPHPLGALLCPRAQPHRRRLGPPAGVDLGHARAQGLPRRGARHGHPGRGQRRLPRRQHADRRAERPLLPVRRAHVGGRHRRRALVRRHAGHRRRHPGRRAGRLHRLPRRASSTRSSSSPSSTTPSSRRWRPCRRSTPCSTPSPTSATPPTRGRCPTCAAGSSSTT